VLVGGLGIGMVVRALLSRHRLKPPRYSDKPSKINSITVVESDPRVIALVAPHFTDKRLTVVEGDVFTWVPTDGQKFDSIWFDIWPTSCTSNLPGIAKLHQRGKYWKRERESFMSSWEVDYLRYDRAQEQRSRWGW